ncbi:MAG: hypothetical protein NT045_09665 [Candidatus Aureabacteria bacterium]|nr:hypothetical protein [Candidatus Auribacterota bacterium]
MDNRLVDEDRIALRLAEGCGVLPGTVGRVADRIGINVRACRFGCF